MVNGGNTKPYLDPAGYDIPLNPDLFMTESLYWLFPIPM